MPLATLPPGTMNAADEIVGPALRAGLADQPAVIDGAGACSYGDLDAHINRHGHALRRAGVRPEERVAFLMDDCIDLMAAYLGVIRIGAVAVACSLRASAEDLLHMLEDSRCRCLYVDAEFLDLYRGIAARLAHPPRLIVNGAGVADAQGIAEFLEGTASEPATVAMSPDDMAFWVYTSGTTGRPKAAVHLHHDVLIAERHLCENLGLRPGDRLLCTSKIFFAYALGHALLAGLRACATVILYRGWPDPEHVAALVERERPAYLFSVPTFYRNLLRTGAARGAGFRAVRIYVSAGEKLPEALFHEWREATGKPILEGIGTTETLFQFIVNTPSEFRPGRSGKAVPWAEMELRDGDGRPVTAPDEPGVLWLHMDSVCDRYWNRQEQSRATFHGPWYRTGDMCSRDAEGWFTHHGRADHMLKISGQWVSPTEIEECAQELAEVAEAAVVGMPNADGLVRMTLFVVPAREDAAPDGLAEGVRAHLLARLSVYKCPRDVRLLRELPRTPTGKLQKFKLCAMLEAERGRG